MLNNRIFQFATLGEDCQDKKYAGEPTRLVIEPRSNRVDIEALMGRGMLTREMADFLAECVRCRVNIVISGGSAALLRRWPSLILPCLTRRGMRLKRR